MTDNAYFYTSKMHEFKPFFCTPNMNEWKSISARPIWIVLSLFMHTQYDLIKAFLHTQNEWPKSFFLHTQYKWVKGYFCTPNMNELNFISAHPMWMS